jgi:hypothetical protein
MLISFDTDYKHFTNLFAMNQRVEIIPQPTNLAWKAALVNGYIASSK